MPDLLSLTVLLQAIALIALIVAALHDIRTREVPDWLSYALLAAALGVRAIYSLVFLDESHILEGIYGFLPFFLLSLLFFYTGIWGGGDSKLLWGMGALIGMRLEFMPDIVLFVLLLLSAGAVYGLVYSTVLAGRNWTSFLKSFRHVLRQYRMLRLGVGAVCILLLVLYTVFMPSGALFLGGLLIIMLYLIPYIFIFSKAVENSCMHRHIAPEKLTEGDWIVKDIVVSGKRITGPKDLGISKEQIKELIRLKKQRKIKTVLVKEGIPFVPVFLLAYIALLLIGPWIRSLLVFLL